MTNPYQSKPKQDDKAYQDHNTI